MSHLTTANTAIGSIVLLHQKSNNYKHTCVHGCTTQHQNDNNKLKPVILKSIAYNHPAVILDLDYSKSEPWALIATITHKPPKGFESFPITGNLGPNETSDIGPLHFEERCGMGAGSNVLIDHAYWVPFGDLGTWRSGFQCRLQEHHYERLMTLLNLPQCNKWINNQNLRRCIRR